MLVAAITHGHVDVVALVLQLYSKHRVQFTNASIGALLHHPNLDILEVLYDHDPQIASFTFHSHIDNFVTKACEQPPEHIMPLLFWLVDHGADLHELPISRTLCNSILYNQTLGVIEAMVSKGARLSTVAMRQAVVCERIKIIRFSMSRKMKIKADDAEYLWKEAVKTGNKEMIELVEEWTSQRSCVVSQ